MMTELEHLRLMVRNYELSIKIAHENIAKEGIRIECAEGSIPGLNNRIRELEKVKTQ